MALKQLIYGTYKSGKSIFSLSMTAYLAGQAAPAIALADDEYAHDWYLDPLDDPAIPPFSVKSTRVKTATIKPHVKQLLGIPASVVPIIYWIRTNELGTIRDFVTAAGSHPLVGGIVIDSISVLWDLASDTVEDSAANSGGLAWKQAKKLMRRFQYALLETEKHYICTSHQQLSYNAQMVITGEGPWTEKKVPHWLDFIARMEPARVGAEKSAPTLTVTGERSGGLIKRGHKFENPSFRDVLEAFKGVVPAREGIVLDATEIEYRNKNTVNKS